MLGGFEQQFSTSGDYEHHALKRTREKNTPVEEEKRHHRREAINILRQLRWLMVHEQDPARAQELLATTMVFSDLLADYLYLDAKNQLIDPKSHNLASEIPALQELLKTIPPDSKHHGPPDRVGIALRGVADDIVLRIEEKLGTLDHPDRQLGPEDALDVLYLFLSQINSISRHQQKAFFEPNTLVAGVLTGGYVEVLVAQRALREFAQQDVQMRVVPVVVHSESDHGFTLPPDELSSVHTIYVVDDFINKGGSVLRASKIVGNTHKDATLINFQGTESAERRAHERNKRYSNEFSGYMADAEIALEEGDQASFLQHCQNAEDFIAETGFDISKYRRWVKMLEDARNLRSSL